MTAPELLDRTLRLRWKTRKGAAQVLGVTSTYLGDVLRGRRAISVSLALKTAKACDLPNFAYDLLTAQVSDDLAAAER